MTKIRVLHVFKTYFPETIGGIEQVIRQLSIAGKKQNIQADVFTLTNKKSHISRLEGQIVYALHRDINLASTGLSADALAMFTRIARHYDVIHYHYPWPFGDLLHLSTKTDTPSIVTYHSDIVRQKTLNKLYTPIQRRFLDSVDAIIATSPNYLASSRTLQKYKEKTSVIPLGVDRSLYPPATPEHLKKWQQQTAPKFFLFIGVLRYYKGLHILLDAIKNTAINVVIAGSGPMEKKLKKQAKDQNIDNAHFVGQITEQDKQALLTLCTAVVLPSHLRSEAFGVTLIEGAIYSKPLISCEIGTGTTYINQHNKTGLSIPALDPGALQRALLSLQNTPEHTASMGKNAYNHYLAHFTIDKVSSQYTTIYKSLTNKKNN